MRSDRTLIVVLAALGVLALVLVLDGDGLVGSLTTDQFANVGYLAVIGVVLAGGAVAAARSNLSGAVRSVLFWAAGFAVLIGLYAYRGEFREIGDRMLAEIVPGHAVEVAGTGGRTVMVMRADDEHFTVNAEVDGTAVTFLVDTGASTVALDRATASRLGYEVSDASFTTLVQTANGTARSAPIVIASLRVGDIERRNVRAAVMDRGGDGVNLLGMSFLGTLSSLDFQGSRLVLTD
jgi:aspartyl protease family protein